MCASREQPLVTQAQIEAELHYVVGQGEPLLHATLHRELPIDTVTLFTRTADEYDAVYAYIAALGPRSPVSHGQTVYVEPADLIINDWRIKYAGVRKPDQSRVERGYLVNVGQAP